jgi:hypothetical protein
LSPGFFQAIAAPLENHYSALNISRGTAKLVFQIKEPKQLHFDL